MNNYDNFMGIYRLVNLVLIIIGYWNLFKKFGVKKWWALIPVVRTLKLAKCLEHEDDGKVYAVTYFLGNLVISLQESLAPYTGENSVSSNMLLVIGCILAFVNIVLACRIYKSICKIFGTSGKQTILWVLFDGLMSVIYGCSKKLQPSVTYFDDIDEDDEEDGSDREKLDTGLSIDIKSRTAGDGLKRKTLLKDIHLDIEPGNMVLLLGGSGAGKTTFLNAVTGYEKANATILLDGENVYDSFEKLKYNIGFVPQQDLIRYRDTVYHTVSDAARLKMPVNISHKKRHERVLEVLNIFGLLPVKNGLVEKQSGGQKKRISIATEFVSDPSVFILDEPDSGLDGIMARELMTRLHDISRQGKIVIVITHTPDRVLDLFDKVIVLAKDQKRTGRLVYYGSIEDAKKFFERDTMEDVVKMINRVEEGGEGKADELLTKYTEALHGKA